MLELLLEFLWSGTLSAPSLGRYWKQSIERSYWTYLNKMQSKIVWKKYQVSNITKDKMIISCQTLRTKPSLWLMHRNMMTDHEFFEKNDFLSWKNVISYLMIIPDSFFTNLLVHRNCLFFVLRTLIFLWCISIRLMIGSIG